MYAADAIHWLEAHGIRWCEADDWLVVWDAWCVGGVLGGEWVTCPRSVAELRDWLGY